MAIQTWGIPPNTWDVGAETVRAHRVVTQQGTDYRKCRPALPADENLVGVAVTTRDPGDAVGVRQLGEALIECAEPVEVGDEVVVAGDGGDAANRGRIGTVGFAGAGAIRVGFARSKTTAAGSLVEVDTKTMGVAATA